MKKLNHGSLFSGIGGFDLASEWMGWINMFHCEMNPFGQNILKYYWPKAELFEDIKKSNFKKYANKIDVLSGGFPCQPYSQAGKRLGTEDDRHLWPQMLRAIQEIKPIYIVGENVYGIVNWNGGMVFDEVQTDLENEGYEVQSVILPACAVGALHRRDRVWFVAYSNNNRTKRNQQHTQSKQEKYGTIANTTNERLQKSRSQFRKEYELFIDTSNDTARSASSQLDKSKRSNRHVPRTNGLSIGLDGIPFSKWKQESIKGYGNAIVPQVALEIFKTIQTHYNQTK